MLPTSRKQSFGPKKLNLYSMGNHKHHAHTCRNEITVLPVVSVVTDTTATIKRIILIDMSKDAAPQLVGRLELIYG